MDGNVQAATSKLRSERLKTRIFLVDALNGNHDICHIVCRRTAVSASRLPHERHHSCEQRHRISKVRCDESLRCAVRAIGLERWHPLDDDEF